MLLSKKKIISLVFVIRSVKNIFPSFIEKAQFLFFFIFIFLNINLRAEGSKELASNGGYRAYLLSSAISGEGIPFPTNGTVKVYAKVGERLYLGSSANKIGVGRINVRAPGGATYSSTDAFATGGLIADRNQETAGPLPNAGGYTPYVITVGAGQEGVWEVDFISPNPSMNPRPAGMGNVHPTQILASGSWAQNNNVSYVTAFDVSVRNASNTDFISGRTFMNIFGGTIGGFNGFNGRFYVLTNDGYIYEVTNNGQAGYVFSFFSNNKGFRDGSGNPQYKSLNGATNPIPVHDPRQNDTATDFTHKLFFNSPNADLPATAFTPTGTTWLTTPIKVLSVTDVVFEGVEGTPNQGGTFPLGGFIKFKTSEVGSYEINIDINKNGVFTDNVDVRLTGSTQADGSNAVYWDGRDGQNVKVTGNFILPPNAIKVSLKGGEVHFPFIDVESNNGGIEIKRVNGANAPDFTVHWDDNDITGNTLPPDPRKTPFTGVNSQANGHKYGPVIGATGAYGDNKSIDTWAYLISSPEIPYLDITFREADLEVLPITTNKTVYCLGEEMTYTIVVKNNGPDAVKGAEFFFDYPSEFNITSITPLFSSVNVGNTVTNSQSTTTQYTATVDLINQATLTLTFKVKLAVSPAGGVVTKASIMRPADVTDPDATNPDTAPPTNPQDECDSGTPGCNNIKSHSGITFSGVDINIGANRSVVEGTGGTNTITFPVTLSTSSLCDISVNYDVSHITTSNQDFIGNISGVLTIPAGQTTGNITLNIATDNIIERNEEFNLTISNVSGANRIDRATAVGIIENDDKGIINITKVDGYEEGTVPAKYIFSFANGITSDCDLEIDYKLSTNSARGNNEDYIEAETGTIKIPAGQSSYTLVLQVIDDEIVEGNETIDIASIESIRSIRPENGTIQIGYDIKNNPSIPIITIFDNDKATIKINPFVTLNEGDAGLTDFTFLITLDGKTSGAFTLNFKTTDGTALISDNDYVSKVEVINIAGNSGTYPVIVQVKGDNIIESDEYFNVTISDLSNNYSGNLTITNATSIGNIINDDLGELEITSLDGTEGGAAAQFIFTLKDNKTADADIVINYTLTGKAIGGGVDYDKPQTGTITLPKGYNTIPLYLNANNDNLVEGTEDVIITVNSISSSKVTIVNNVQSLNILDINTAGISIADAEIIEGNAGTSLLRFKVTLTGRTDTDFSILFTLQDITTTAGTDYILPATNTISFSPNLATQERFVEIEVKGDYQIEADETFRINLGAPSKTFSGNLLLQQTYATGKIINDDSGIITVTATHGNEEGEVPVKFKFAFPLGVSSDKDTEITFSLAGSSATPALDYKAPAIYSVTIPAGENSETLTLEVIDDVLVEGTETIVLTPNPIVGIPNVSVNVSAVTANIYDNDTAKITITAPTNKLEGDIGEITELEYIIKLDNATEKPFQITYKTADGTAKAGEDYDGILDTYTFPAGTANHEITISVKVKGDRKIEADETFQFLIEPLVENFGGRLTLENSAVTSTIINDDQANIIITKIDGIEGSQNARFTIGFENNYSTDLPISIPYTLSGTAINGTDYTANATGTITINPGQTAATLDLIVVDDNLVEDTETVILTLANTTLPYGITFTELQKTLNILDNDKAEINITNASVLEGDENDRYLVFDVAISGANIQDPFDLSFSVTEGTATAGQDYEIPATTTLHFNGPTDRTKQIQILVKGDLIIEKDETLQVILGTLSKNFGGSLTINKNTATGTILNNDKGIISITPSNGYEEGEVSGSFVFSYLNGVTSDEPTTINFNLSGEAELSTDFTLNPSSTTSITIPAGETSATIEVKVIDDEIIENTEDVTLTTTGISSPYAPLNISIANSPQKISIIDNDKGELILTRDVDVLEGGEGETKVVKFKVKLTKATAYPFSVSYQFTDITAANGEDYLASNGTWSFVGNAGEEHEVSVTINGDFKIEDSETFRFHFENPSYTYNGAISVPVNNAVFTIINDDSAQLSITKQDGEEGGNDGYFTIGLPAGYTLDKPIQISYILSGTATADDYAPLPGTITLPANTNAINIPIVIVDDDKIEGDEFLTITANITTPVYGISFSNNTSTLKITDNDYGTVSINNVTVNEEHSGEHTLAFDVTLNVETEEDFNVNYSTADGTATAGEDYQAKTNNFITFSGVKNEVKHIEIKYYGDKKVEADETFKVLLQSLSKTFDGHLSINAASSIGTATLTNDDFAVVGVQVTNGSENGTKGIFRFYLQNGATSDKPITLNYTLGGTAINVTDKKDYTITHPTTVTIPAGADFVDVELTIIDDEIVEGTETVKLLNLQLFSDYSGVTLSSTISDLSITDNDEAQVMITALPEMLEGDDSSIKYYEFKAKLNKETADKFDIDYTTANGTALTSDADYVAKNGTLHFLGTKDEEIIIQVQINGDNKIEPDENFFFTLSNLTNNFENRLTIPEKTKTAIIKNDDFADIVITKQDGAEGGQPAIFTFTLSNNKTVDEDIYINYTLDNTSAVAGTDFTVSHASPLLLAKGSNSVTLTLNVIDDTIVEETETVKITAQTQNNPRNNIKVNNTIETLNIFDNDEAKLSINNPVLTEGDSGIKYLEFIVSLDKATQKPFTVKYSTVDNTAIGGEDFVAVTDQIISFNALSTTAQKIQIAISGDKKVEADETFFVNLHTLSNNFEGRLHLPLQAATGTIQNDDLLKIAISGTNGQEEGEVAGTFKFSLLDDAISDKPITIKYTLGGDALGNGIDYYNVTTGTVVIPANASEATLSINVKDDEIVELNESVILNATIENNPYPAEIALVSNTYTIYIEDNDVATLTLSGLTTIPEGDSGIKEIIYTVTLDKATATGFSLDYTIQDLSATRLDDDYQASNGTLNFVGTIPGESQVFSVYIKGDHKIEPDEFFRILLANPTNNFNNNLTVASPQTDVKIVNDDFADIVITKQDGAEGGQPASFTFTLSNNKTVDEDITIDYVLDNISATAGTDFTVSQPSPLILTKGNNSVTLTLNVIDDTIVEGTETVTITAQTRNNPRNNIKVTNTTETLNIADNDETTLLVSNPEVLEGQNGETDFIFEISIAKPTQRPFTVSYKTEDETALAGEDYIAVNNGVLSFPALSTAKQTITIKVKGDLKLEADETFKLLLTSLSDNFGAKLNLPTTAATGKIINDDSAIITITGTNGKEAGEVAGTFRFSLPNNVKSDQPIKINYTLSGEALGNGIDYTHPLTGSITIPANTSDAVLNINVVDDNILEYNESVIINATIDNSTSYFDNISLSNNTHTIYIEDNDNATLTLSGPAKILEGNDGFTPVVYTVALSNPVTAGFKVKYDVEELTAKISDDDFQFSPGELQFTGTNATSATFTIYIKGDKKIESNETFRIILTPDQTFNNRLTVQGAPLLVEITNDDFGSIVIEKEDGEESPANDKPAKFIFRLLDGMIADQDIVLPYSLSVNSARGEGVDYIGNLTGSITINKNKNEAVLELPIVDDNIVEGTETVTIQIANVALPYGITLTETSKTLNIIDNDEAQISISNASVVEGNNGTSYLDFTLSLNNPVQESFTINYQTEDITAIAGEDYQAIDLANGSITFNALSTTSKTIRVNVNPDLKIEADETMQLLLQTLSNNFGGRLHLPATAGIGTIINDDSAIITLTGTNGKEAGEVPGIFKFSLPANVTSDQPIKINYTLSGVALGNGIDYTNAQSGELIIPANSSEAILEINVKDDNILEFDESVTLTAAIANETVYYPSNISLPSNIHTIYIEDNDVASLTINGPLSIKEGDFGTKTLTFNVTLSNPVASSFTVKYHSVNGTATIEDNDYQAVDGTLSFSGQTANETYPIQVTINGDTKIEGDEYFEIILDQLTENYGGRFRIVGSPARAIIIDDDNENINKIITITKQDGEEGIKDASFTFSFPPGVSLDRDTEIFFSLSGTATKDADYEVLGSATSIIIPAGQNSKTLTLKVFDDTVIEGTEDVKIITANISNSLYQDITISNPTYSLDIFDNDNGTILIESTSITEGNAGTKEMVFNVTLSNPTSREFRLEYYTQDNTATLADNDYVAITDGLLVLGPQAGTKQIKVLINGDVNVEKDEIFNLILKPLSDTFNGRLTIVNQSVEGKIINDDSTIITITKQDGEEGGAPVKFKFSFPENVFSDEPTEIIYSLSGTATANLDYMGNSTGTVTILPYQNSVELILPVIDDVLIEGDETVIITANVNSVYGSSITLNPIIPVAIIKDNDNAKLKINGPITVTEGNVGTTPVNFTVTLEGNIGESFEVKFSTEDGTATVADNDYIPKTDNVLTFSGNPGETKTITVFVNGDKNIEADEYFFVNLHDLSKNFNGLLTIEGSPAKAIILDDDNNPTNKSITVTKTNGSEVDLSPVTFTFSFPAGVLSDAITTIPYSLSGTATGNGVDYDGIISGNIAIPAGQNSITLTLPVKQDAITEGTEIVKLTTGEVINGSYNGIKVVNPSIEAEIEDGNTTYLTINDIEIIEGNIGTSLATFRLKLNGATAKPFTVDYQTANGTATVADFDYVARTGKLSFNGLANEEREVSITIIGDKKLEADETFKLLLSNIQGDFDRRLILDRTEAIATIKNDDDLVITVTGTNGAEAGTVPARFIFSLPAGYTSDIPTLINYTLGGQATGGGTDYIGSVNGVIAIPAGEERVILTLPVIDDEIVEKDEDITITINSINTNYPANITYNPILPIIKIIDNDATVLRLSNAVQLKEGNSGTTPFEYTITLEKATGTGFTVKYTTEDGTATLADNDYNKAEGVLSFSGTAGESHTVTVFVNGDLKIEGNEIFKFRVFDLDSTFNNRLTIPVSVVNGIIENDDNSLITITKVDGIEGTQDGKFDLTLDPGVTSDKDIIINYRLSGTATTSDYQAIPSATTVTIPAGQNSASIAIKVIDDDILEETETVVLNILNIINPYNNVTAKQPVPILYIYDNDITKLTIISPAPVEEGNSGVTPVTFTIKLENTTDKGFTIQYTTVDISATIADNDYQKKSGSLSFAGFGGETKTVTVFINGDTKPEGHEFFGLKIFNLFPDFDGKLLLDTNGRATILNDDVAPIAADDYITTEEDTPVTFSITDNDSQADGIDPATITITVPPINGRLVTHPDGTVTYSPKLNFFGYDYFYYSVRDVFGRYSNEAKVNITVTPVNDAPIANDDVYYVQRDSSIREKVSLNDEDPDGDVLTFKRITNTQYGTIAFFDSNDGTFIYVPQQGFKGIDKFTYYAQDPEGLRDTAEVILYVQPKVRIDLTPNYGVLIEGDSISITAKLTEFIYQDVNVVLNFEGTALENKDYTLSGNYDVITIPARDTITTHKFWIHSLKDYLKEGDENIEIKMTNVDPAAFVNIGEGADIIIKDFYPADNIKDPDENGDINPDPYMSPNGDGLGNEKFVIYNIERYPDNEVIIYNRWGNEVFTTKGYDNKDNAFSGFANKGMLSNSSTQLVDGVYYFIIKTKDSEGKPKRNKGYVIIRR